MLSGQAGAGARAEEEVLILIDPYSRTHRWAVLRVTPPGKALREWGWTPPLTPGAGPLGTLEFPANALLLRLNQAEQVELCVL